MKEHCRAALFAGYIADQQDCYPSAATEADY